MENEQIAGPFGPARHLESITVSEIARMYERKCGIDVMPHFKGLESIDLYLCRSTGYRFWRPAEVAGDESFYRDLSAVWPEYYRDWRWEYGPMLSALRSRDNLLEVGCGRGYFLRLSERRVASATGLELNREAISNKVTRHEIKSQLVSEFAKASLHAFDVVCSFQVLEHVTAPDEFVKSCLAAVKPGGLLAVSTPNREHRVFSNRKDAFDLPPHHIGHFSPAVYRRLAQRYGLRIESILLENRFSEHFNPGLKTTARRLLNRMHRIVRGPGASVLVLFRVPS